MFFNPMTINPVQNNINGIDRVLIKAKFDNLVYNEKKAMQTATHFCDKCTMLEQKCRHLETDKKAVRYFWRNKLIEGQARAAKMLRSSLSSTK